MHPPCPLSIPPVMSSPLRARSRGCNSSRHTCIASFASILKRACKKAKRCAAPAHARFARNNVHRETKVRGLRPRNNVVIGDNVHADARRVTRARHATSLWAAAAPAADTPDTRHHDTRSSLQHPATTHAPASGISCPRYDTSPRACASHCSSCSTFVSKYDTISPEGALLRITSCFTHHNVFQS